MQRAALILLVLVAGTLAAEDSPLVAAAKSRKNAKVKSKIVITNETLSKSNGSSHISTTARQPEIMLKAAPPLPEPPKTDVKTIGTEKAEKPKAAQPDLPPMDDAERFNEGPVTPEDFESPFPDPLATPIVIIPKGMAVDPKTGKHIEDLEKEQQEQKPPQD